jgi:hypothetical protein
VLVRAGLRRLQTALEPVDARRRRQLVVLVRLLVGLAAGWDLLLLLLLGQPCVLAIRVGVDALTHGYGVFASSSMTS